jgi:hypothetical protein
MAARSSAGLLFSAHYTKFVTQLPAVLYPPNVWKRIMRAYAEAAARH